MSYQAMIFFRDSAKLMRASLALAAPKIQSSNALKRVQGSKFKAPSISPRGES
jgi:hypothetical protein